MLIIAVLVEAHFECFYLVVYIGSKLTLAEDIVLVHQSDLRRLALYIGVAFVHLVCFGKFTKMPAWSPCKCTTISFNGNSAKRICLDIAVSISCKFACVCVEPNTKRCALTRRILNLGGVKLSVAHLEDLVTDFGCLGWCFLTN